MEKFLKSFGQAAKLALSAFFFFLFLGAVLFLFWIRMAKPYLGFLRPSGGDIYNALTYAHFFKRYLTWPPSGWMHLLNEGTAVVGGYPWGFFYLVYPFYQFFDVTTAIQVLSLLLLGFFFTFSFILFLLVSRSLLLSFVFTLVLIFTKASYSDLFTNGFVAANATQWLLPASLIFLYRVRKGGSRKYLVLAALTVGFSFLLHTAVTALLIFPASLLMILLTSFKWRQKLTNLVFYLAFLIPIACLGLYTLFIQVELGQCTHPNCWGAYPEHFLWFNALAFFYPLLLLAVMFLVKLFKRSLNLRTILPFLAALLVPVLYALAAYLKLIDGLAMAFFPRRTFWAISLLALLIGAASFRAIKKVLPKFSFLISLAIFLSLVGYWFIRPLAFGLNASHLMDYPASYPMDAWKFVLSKYQTEDFSGRVPEWLPYQENDYRLDNFNQEMNVWWNIVSDMPITRGYSNQPLGRHRDWQYLLQESLSREQPPETAIDYLKNKAYFLLDAFGVGFYENSGSPALHPSLIADRELVEKKEEVHGLYLKYSPKIVTPIVYPTNTPAVLFVGDEEGYANFIRTAALANLNSRIIIPVKGPENFDKLTQGELSHFRNLVLYRFKGKKWAKLADFVRTGGNLFLESGSLPEIPSGLVPEVFPVGHILEDKKTEPHWDEGTQILREMKINQKLFSPLVYEGKSWTLVTALPEDVRDWAEPVLVHEEKVIMAQGQLGEGRVVWSGLNFLYHVANKDNFEEAKLFGKIVEDFTGQDEAVESDFQVMRFRPENIQVKAQGVTGVYFKENYHTGWGASVNGKKLKLYRAGLDFMYFPVANQPTNAQVLIKFRGNLLAWALFILTIFGVFLSFTYLVFAKPFHLLEAKTKKSLARRRQWLSHVWERD